MKGGPMWHQDLHRGMAAFVVVLILISLLTVPGVATTSVSTAAVEVHHEQQPTTRTAGDDDDIQLRDHDQRRPPPPRLPLNGIIHVLPPSPDDTPKECDASKKLYESCGPERYCAKLPPSDDHSDEDVVVSAWWLQQENKTTTYYCLHKTLWFPELNVRDVIAFVLTGTCCFLAAMAGIGGGGLILPILLLCCNFTPKEASVLSNTAVFCNTAGQFCINNFWSRQRQTEQSSNNNSGKPSLIYATVLMIMPGLIAGGSIAITMEGMVPSTVILILALLTLLLASYKTYHKAQRMRAAEREMAMMTPTTPPASPTPLLMSPTRTRALQHQRNDLSPEEAEAEQQQQQEQDEALIASALEFGEVATPASKAAAAASSSRGTLKDAPTSPSNTSDIMEEKFLGSIGYLNRDTTSTDGSNCVNIIDETSMTASYEMSTVQSLETTSISTTATTTPPGVGLEGNEATSPHHQQPPLEEEQHSATTDFWVYLYEHKLQLLIFTCWVLDATTFLLLHTGTLIRKCSLGFFLLVVTPAIVAIIFVGLGRQHLLAVLAGTSRRNTSVEQGEEDEEEMGERQPLIATTFFQPIQGEGGEANARNDQDDHGEAYEPVPNLEPIVADEEERSMSSSSSTSSSPQTRNWILMVPLISAFTGIARAFQHHQSGGVRSNRRVSSLRRQSQASVPDLSEPLLHHEQLSPATISNSADRYDDYHLNDDESPIHNDFESLLAGWLPWASVLIGLLAALLGIGGGELLGPILLLLLKMNPQQSSATTAIMSMMNSGTNLLHYMVADMMKAPGYAINLGIAGLVGGSGGRLQAMSMADSGRTSIIAMSLFVVLSLATALVAWELVTTPMSWRSNGSVC